MKIRFKSEVVLRLVFGSGLGLGLGLVSVLVSVLVSWLGAGGLLPTTSQSLFYGRVGQIDIFIHCQP